MSIRPIVLDFETYYSRDYSLRKMTPPEYVLDPRFEAIGCAVAEPWTSNHPTYWIDGPDLPHFFRSLDPANTLTITHNALFDNFIMSLRYGFVPKMMACTMSIARATYGHRLRSVSLKAVAQYLGLPPKGDTVHKVEGMNLAMIREAGLYDDYVAYSKHDADLCAAIYDKLVRSGTFPVSELVVLDNVLRCAIEPKFSVDQQLLSTHLMEVRAKKEALLRQAMAMGVTGKGDLMSSEKFAGILRGLGVEPPMKISPATGKETYAFAKSDPEFVALSEHDDAAVQAIVGARLGHKSTLEETRTEKLLRIAQLTWPSNASGLLPMPLRYGGTHTHRLSGDWGINVQNMPSRKDNTMRRAIIAPPDHVIFTIDAAQIEARIVAWICGQDDLVEAFAQGQDVYCIFAGYIFGREVTKADKMQRFIGKTGVLGLGFGVGWPKFQAQIEIDSKNQMGEAITLPDEEAQRIVSLYRTKYFHVPNSWRELNTTGINVLAYGGSWQFGPCSFEKGRVRLPNGLYINYDNLEQVEGEWWYTYGRERKKLYGGKLLENIVQALARIIVMDAAVRIRKRMLPFGLQVHDELVYVVHERLVAQLRAVALEEMRRRPTWGPDLPIDAEAGVGPNYGDAK